ncbi:Nif11-like leader peptide family natural product precursor [Prochlorococcus marinus]|nr:Nif11-like leader peptide family natural product precursor [Prochlorococcus marinus]
MNELEAFIAEARRNPNLQAQLKDCALEKWGDQHTPLDVDTAKVIEVAKRAGFHVSEADICLAQCQQLNNFWRFEMENAFVARRTLARIQMQILGSNDAIDYYSF